MPGTCLDILRDVQNQFIMVSQNLRNQLVEHEAIAHPQCLPLVLLIPSGLGVGAVQWRGRLTRRNAIWRAVAVRHNAISEVVRRTQRKLKVLRVNGCMVAHNIGDHEVDVDNKSDCVGDVAWAARANKIRRVD